MKIMIQAKELRIGNLVSLFDFTATVNHLGKSTMGYTVDGINTSATYEVLNPIPLTPEILKMCGFKHGMVEGVTRLRDADDFSEDEGDTHYWDLRVPKNDKVEGLSTFNLVKFGDDDLTFSCQWLRVKLYYLHELQNLYFWLTGIELNVQLSEPKVE